MKFDSVYRSVLSGMFPLVMLTATTTSAESWAPRAKRESVSPVSAAMTHSVDTTVQVPFARDKLRDEAIALLSLARQAWVQSELRRHGDYVMGDRPSDLAIRRLNNIHCHFDDSFSAREGGVGTREVPLVLIREVGTRFSVCPDWRLVDPRSGLDESRRSDALLSSPWYDRVVAARLQLIDKLVRRTREPAAEPWHARQLVRFLMDAGEVEQALVAARTCVADMLTCLKLEGYVLNERGDIAAADSVFKLVLAQLPPEERCRWGSLADLVPREDRAKYEEQSCAARKSLNDIIWWLGDPMYSEAGNERRAEHFARVVRTELHFEFPTNEHWDLLKKRGGMAIRLMLLRYGWPSLTFYGGPTADWSHSRWLGADAYPPFSAPEYSTDRVSTLALWSALGDPFSVTNADFQLTAPMRLGVERWGPREHMRRRTGIVAAFPEGQYALFRRDSSVLLVVASRLIAPALVPSSRDLLRSTLVVSAAPDSVRRVDASALSVGGRFVLQGNIPSGQSIAAVEVPAVWPSRVSVRSRFGIVAPPTLASMAANEMAVSQPVLFDPEAVSSSEQRTGVLLNQMHSSLVLVGAKSVGVFWESYGFRAGDTVDVTVQAERISEIGGLRRLGMALRVADDPNGEISARWTEPSPARSSRSIPAIVPTASRQVVLNISNFREGTYRLRVSMQKKNADVVFGERIFELKH